MIFVTLGTHEQRFERALDEVALLDADEPMLIQHGFTPRRIEARHCRWVEFMEWEALVRAMTDASVVITHGGVGSVVTAMRAGKRPVVIPRTREHGEHVDNHQLQLALRFAQTGRIHLCGPDDSLRAVVAACRRESRAPMAPDATRLRDSVARAIFGPGA